MFKPETYQLKLLRALSKQIRAYSKDQKAERLHQMRLLIKKVKAIASLKRFAIQKKQNLSKLKALHKSAGKIREIQVLLKLIQALPHFPKNTIKQLQNREKSEQQFFLDKLPKFTKQVKKIQNEFSNEETKINLKTIKKYFKQETHKTHEAFVLRQREAMHSFRKELKNSLYVYDALPKKLQKLIPIKTDEIKILQEKLGDWHDTYSAIYYLSKLKPDATVHEHVLKLKREEKVQFVSLQKVQAPIM